MNNSPSLLFLLYSFRPAIKCENEKNLIGDHLTGSQQHNNGDIQDSTVPPRYLNVQRGKISFGPPPLPPQRIPTSDKDEKDAVSDLGEALCSFYMLIGSGADRQRDLLR